MFLIMYLIIIAFSISSLIFGAAWALNFRMNISREKLSPYECGFDPVKNARLPFSLRFFFIAVIFLVFDIEIILLLPLPFIPFTSFSTTALVSSMFFILILIFGLLHEWNEGSLEW